jgi:hypothetical protein
MITQIYIRENLAFLNDTAIYLETEYSSRINEFIQTNYFPIKEALLKKEISFIYLPKVLELSVPEDFLKAYIDYNYPGNSTEFFPDFLSIQNQLANGNHLLFLIDLLKKQNITGCGLLYKRVSKIYDDSYCFYWLELDENKNLVNQLISFIEYSNYYDGPSIQALGGWELEDEDLADSHFETDANALAEDVLKKIEYLRQKKEYAILAEIAYRMFDGNHLALKEHFVPTHKIIEISTTITPIISRLRVEWKSKYDFDIILPDYGNMVVDMPRLPKSLYYFFLQHPEGIMLNSLIDYHDELLKIYRRISNLSNECEIIRNINRLTDPFDNSVNVNCSRIKSAFVKLIDDEIACNYYITGGRGYSKRIKLTPDLIEIIDRYS